MQLTQPTTATKNSSATGAAACPVCGSELVYPLERSHVGSNSWQLLMLCPDCFAWVNVSVDHEGAEEILLRQRLGRETLACELASLERRHMEEECEKFISALGAGAIQPIDF